MKKKIPQFLLALCLAGWMSAAQAAASAEEAVREYFAALQAEGMGASARFIHPDELARFKEMLMPVVRQDFKRAKPEFAPVVFGADVTLEKMEAMSGQDFMGALLNVVGSQMKDVKFESVQVLGAVKEGEVSHVVARINVGVEQGAFKLTKMEVISAKPSKDGWMVLLSGELEGLAAALSKM